VTKCLDQETQKLIKDSTHLFQYNDQDEPNKSVRLAKVFEEVLERISVLFG